MIQRVTLKQYQSNKKFNAPLAQLKEARIFPFTKYSLLVDVQNKNRVHKCSKLKTKNCMIFCRFTATLDLSLSNLNKANHRRKLNSITLNPPSSIQNRLKTLAVSSP